jgi:hypothetical protein
MHWIWTILLLQSEFLTCTCSFFIIPVAAVQSLLALENVDQFPGVSTILDNAFLKGALYCYR